MNKTIPPLWVACVPLVILVALISSVVAVFGDDSLSGGSQVALLVASVISLLVGWTMKTLEWERFEQLLAEKVGVMGQAIFILFLIGALGGAWMVGGVVPSLIYYGIGIMHPQWFLVSACVISAIVSVMTGSSWTTVATMGVALIGIGQAMGYDSGWIAGAVISGAYFGDKISPLSDTTILASSTAGTPLFTHIHYMVYTTLPTFLIAMMVFAVRGFMQDSADAMGMTMLQDALSRTFYISPWMLLVPVFTFLLIWRKMPALVVLFLATLMGILLALFFQPNLLDEIAGEGGNILARRFKGCLLTVYGSTQIDSSNALLNELIHTRGMQGMLSTIWLILCATLFGVSMSTTRMIESLMRGMLTLVRGTVSLVASTSFTGILLNIVTADQYLSIILTGNIFLPVYKDKGYENRLLSRTCEDSTTVTSVLVPWNTCGITQSTILGVATMAYLPYCVFNYLSPIMSLLIAAKGYKIVRGKGE